MSKFIVNTPTGFFYGRDFYPTKRAASTRRRQAERRLRRTAGAIEKLAPCATYSKSEESLMITCPKCGMTSHNPHDEREGYCGNCHEFMDAIPEIPALYEIARDICHKRGLPWTDPRTGVTYPPPKEGTNA